MFKTRLPKVPMLAVVLMAFAATLVAQGGEKLTATQLIELSKAKSPKLAEAIHSTFEAKSLDEGTAWLGRGSDFFFAAKSASEPKLMIDGAFGPKMQKLK